MEDYPPQPPESRAGTTRSAATQRGEEHVRVVVRVRPLNAREVDAQHARGVVVADDDTDPRTVTVVGADSAAPPKNMSYDRVYAEPTSQADLFEDCGVIPLLNRALAGYSATVFAFGQTGSGKTFTMTGPPPPAASPDAVGLIPRALRHLFEVIAATPGTRFTVRAAYLEIYNEQVQDLLNPSAAALPVRWKRDRGFYVENLFVVECEVLDDCLAVLEEGLRNRTTGAHALNERSSRSHSILTVYIEAEDESPPGDDDDGRPAQRFGKISFVDLAGSERVKDSKTTGEALNETFNINRSLLVLGNCISALSDPKRKPGHVPYRDSKLTKLLMDSLGGNGVALMIACVSPSAHAIQETVQTLRYASRAKRIRNRPYVNVDPREQLIARLKREVDALKTENAQLKVLAQRGTPSAAVVSTGGGNGNAVAQLAQTYGVEIDSLKYENAQLVAAKQRTEHMYGNLMRENEALRDELDRLRSGGAMPSQIPQPQWAAPNFYPAAAAARRQPAYPPQPPVTVQRGGGGPSAPAPTVASPRNGQQQQPGRASRHGSTTPAGATAAAGRRSSGPPPPQQRGSRSPQQQQQAVAEYQQQASRSPQQQGSEYQPSPRPPPQQEHAYPPPAQARSPPSKPPAGGVPDLHSLRQDVSRLDAEIARYTGGAGM
ncbi:hypothetical protein H9P43_009469 [Blastocladiella emersonii ATCC 22665]|nr:hypothetical protein H9P43_009469 [Blastocladiella emersonii ATCC 22665]